LGSPQVQNAAPPKRTRSWLTLVDSLVATLEPGEPLTFVLGAGASLSSGAPTTGQVEQKWLSALAGTFSDKEALRTGITLLGDDQKINPIKPLFDSIKPFIGYHCLASLGRDRPILVLNLNWDDALEQACGSVGVPHLELSVDTQGELTGDADGVRSRLEAGEPGVYSLHVHGQLENPESSIRFGLYETLKFSDRVKALLDDYFFIHPLVVAGASLRGDYDVIDLLRGLTDPSTWSTRRVSPFYIFSRQEERAKSPSDGLMQNVLFSRKSVPNFRGDPAVDFDRLLLDLATRLKGHEFPAGAEGAPEMIPKLEELAIPSRAVLGSQADHADRHAIVIEGDARIGKTEAALLLAHLFFICDEQAPKIAYHRGPKECVGALEGFLGAKRTEVPNRVLIVEDPFGENDEFDPNPEFVKLLRRYLKTRPKGTGRARTSTSVIVTSRSSKWRRAAKQLTPIDSASVRSVPIAGWYENDELAAYLESSVGHDALIRREIHKRELATPLAIQEAISDSTGGREVMVAEKVAFLRSLDEATAWYVVLARLQELWPSGMSELPLHEPGDADRAFAEVELMLRKKTLDGNRYIVPAHSVDREAIDLFFGAEKAKFFKKLDELHGERGDPGPACELWRAIRALRDGSLDELMQLPERDQLDWGPMFMGEAARIHPKEVAKDRVIEVMEALRYREGLSAWSMRELVFEMIRLWPLLREREEARKFLDDVLEDDDRMGRYLLVEALMYVQAATYPDTWDLSAYAEVWDKLAAARHRLLRAPEEHALELAMLFDAFTWCPPRLEPNELSRWLDPLIARAEECSKMATAMQFSRFYHPKGAEYLRQRGVEGLDAELVPQHLSPEDAEAAVFMIRWHFIHQSRVRAMLYRRDMEPLHAHLISRLPPSNAEPLTPGVAKNCERMVRALAEYPEHAGWAIHLAISVATTRTGFSPGCVAAVIGQLPDRDPGLITATLTYAIPDPLVPPVVDYFSKPENAAALLDALVEPPVVDGIAVGPPAYCAARFPTQIYEVLHKPWTKLANDDIPVRDEYALLKLVHGGAAAAMALDADGRPSDAAFDEAVETIVRGDLREFEALPLRHPADASEPTSPEVLMADRLLSLAWEIERRPRD
jgi:hypothetical protein